MKKSIKTVQNQVFDCFCTETKSTIHNLRDFQGPKKTVCQDTPEGAPVLPQGIILHGYMLVKTKYHTPPMTGISLYYL